MSKFFITAKSGVRPFINKSKKLTDQLKEIELPKRFQGTIIEKWKNYWKHLLLDYKEVIIDSGRTIKSNPIKSTIYGSLIGSLYYCYKKNPDYEAYELQLKNSCNEIILVNEMNHRKESAEYLTFIQRCINEGILRRLSLGVVSFLWLDNYDKAVAIYKATCPYLQPNYLKLHERIIDIGFLNSWWNLNKKMKDYDICEDLD